MQVRDNGKVCIKKNLPGKTVETRSYLLLTYNFLAITSEQISTTFIEVQLIRPKLIPLSPSCILLLLLPNHILLTRVILFAIV